MGAETGVRGYYRKVVFYLIPNKETILNKVLPGKTF